MVFFYNSCYKAASSISSKSRLILFIMIVGLICWNSIYINKNSNVQLLGKIPASIRKIQCVQLSFNAFMIPSISYSLPLP